MSLEEKKKVARMANLGLIALTGLAVIAFAAQGEWLSALSTFSILLLMASPILLRDKLKVYIPFELEISIIGFIFLTLFLGSFAGFYEKYPWWDLALHSASGPILGIASFVFIYLLNEDNQKLNLSPGFIAFFSVTFSMALSVMWEFYEFAYDRITGGKMMENGLPDTMLDLIVNAIGATLVAVIAYIWMKRRRRLPLTPQKLES